MACHYRRDSTVLCWDHRKVLGSNLSSRYHHCIEIHLHGSMMAHYYNNKWELATCCNWEGAWHLSKRLPRLLMNKNHRRLVYLIPKEPNCRFDVSPKSFLGLTVQKHLQGFHPSRHSEKFYILPVYCFISVL